MFDLGSYSKILIIFPHPDDETFSCAGLIQKALKLKSKVKVVSLTKGEASTLRYGLASSAELATVRTSEFFNVGKILGLDDSDILDFKDGFIKQQYEDVEKCYLDLVSGYQPDLVVTFEPSGIYGHPDHISLSQIVTSHFSENESYDLLYSTVPKSWRSSESSLKMAENPSAIHPTVPNLGLKLSVREINTKLQALRCYKSHFKLTLTSVLRFALGGVLFTEWFVLLKPQKKS